MKNSHNSVGHSVSYPNIVAFRNEPQSEKTSDLHKLVAWLLYLSVSSEPQKAFTYIFFQIFYLFPRTAHTVLL